MASARTLTPLLLLLLAACGDGDGTDEKNPPGPGDAGGDTGVTGDDGGSTVPTTEQDCEDGLDEDQDGAADCLDSDCADYWTCNLPDALDYRGVVDFQGNTIECEAWGIEFDYDVDDCATDASGRLGLVTDDRACPECDRTYYGTLSYATDSCSEMLETASAPDALFGLVFLSETERELYAQDPSDGAWYYLETMTRTDGPWTLSGSEAVWADPDDCDNGDQNLGTLTITTTFRDLPGGGG